LLGRVDQPQYPEYAQPWAARSPRGGLRIVATQVVEADLGMPDKALGIIGHFDANVKGDGDFH
jgi:hypothetical protein